jgi:hypothetical protein
MACRILNVSQAVVQSLGRKASRSLKAPTSSVGSYGTLWRLLGGCHAPWARPHGGPAGPASFKSPNFPAISQGPLGDRLKLKRGGGSHLWQGSGLLPKPFAFEHLSRRSLPDRSRRVWRQPSTPL